MAAQHFFLGQRHLGTRQIPDMRIVPGLDLRLHYSYAYFCMRCGDIWGRLLHDRGPLTQCIVRPCQRHGDGRFSATYTYPGEPTNFEADWPAGAVAHEFQCELVLAEHLAKTGNYCASPGVSLHT